MQRSLDYFERVKQLDGDIIASHSLEGAIARLKELNLLRSENPTCRHTPNCNKLMRVIHDSSRLDGVIYRCPVCQSKRSLRFSSIFEDTRLPIGSLYRIFYAFAHDYSTSEATQFTISDRSTVKQVVSSSISAQRAQMQLIEVEGDLLGGVELDESLVTHLHPQQGENQDRYDTQVWVFGMIERNTNRFICYAIGNSSQRTIENIQPLIQRHIPTTEEIQTRIYTDGGLWYSFLSEANYNHIVIVHEQGFGQGDYTTNHIESLWSRIKGKGHFKDGKNYYTVEQVQEEIDVIKWRLDTPRDQLLTSLAQMCSTHYQQTQQKIRDIV